MKSCLLFATCIIATSMLVAQPGPPATSTDSVQSVWSSSWQQLQQAASSQSRPVLLLFAGSDWCRPCMQWEQEVFEQEAFVTWAADHVMSYRADFPRKKKNRLSSELEALHGELAAAYNPKGLFPYCILLSPSGEVLAATGYLPGGPPTFLNWADRTLSTLSDASHE